MKKTNPKVIVINPDGNIIATYDSIDAVAEEYHCSTYTIVRYIERGTFWKAKRVYLDFALD